MLYRFGEHLVDIDVEKTRSFYKDAECITEGCTCDGCCNYEQATDYFPEKVKAFFEEIGVDLKKAAEIMTWVSENDKKDVLCGGFYHICGEIKTEENLWKTELQTETALCLRMDEEEMYPITENYKVGFSSGCLLLEENFPLPVIQMEIMFLCPWVLNIENSY